MTRLACCLLLLFPVIAYAQDDDAIAPASKVVSVEITILELSGHLKVSDPEKIDMDKLQQAVRDARQAGVFRHLTRVRLSTLEQEKALVQLGETQTVPTGRSQFSGRPGVPQRISMSYREVQTGTLVSVVPRISGKDDIILELQIEESRLRPAPPARNDDADDDDADDDDDDEDEDEDDTPMPPRSGTLTVQTTVKVPNGQTVLISGAQTANAQSDQLQTYVMVRATTSG